MSYSENALFNDNEIEHFRRQGLSGSTVSELLRQAESISGGRPAENASALTETEEMILRDGGALGLDTPAHRAALTEIRLLVRALADELLLERRSLSAAQVAAHLQVPSTEVTERSSHGRPQSLYSFCSRSNDLLYPKWQFIDMATIPHLADLLSAISEGIHPVALDRFMLTPSVDLEVDGRTLSPKEWLLSGADPEPVKRLAVDL